MDVCRAPKDGVPFGDRCGEPAAFRTKLGPRCTQCVERYRRDLASPNALINALRGRPMTKDEIEAGIVAIQ